MANEQNLKPLNTRPQRERKEIARKGAAASNKAQKEKKKAKEIMKAILELSVKGDKNKKMLEQMGIKKDEQDNKTLLLSRMFMKAASTGDYNAIRAILEMSGDLTAQTEQQSPTININVSAATTDDVETDD